MIFNPSNFPNLPQKEPFLVINYGYRTQLTELDILRRMPQLNTPGAQAQFAKRLQDGDEEALAYLKIINRVKDNMKNKLIVNILRTMQTVFNISVCAVPDRQI